MTGNGVSHVVDSSGGANVSPTADGSQTLSIPMLSSDNNQIVAFEQDVPDGQCCGNLLSVGEADLGSFPAGTAPVIALTMLMNAQNIGVMSDPDNGNGDAQTYSPYYSQNTIVSAPAAFGPLYFFASDAEGGFVDLAGAGGISLPTLKSWTSDITGPANTLAQGPGISGGYTVSINNNNLCYGVTANLTAANPAWPVAYDAYYNQNSFSGIDFLYQNGYDSNFGNYVYNLVNFNSQSFNQSIDLVPNGGC